MNRRRIEDSSTESQHDFSDELNESTYYHSFFNREDLEKDLDVGVEDRRGVEGEGRGREEEKREDQVDERKAETGRGYFSGFFSKIWSNNEEDEIEITSLASNGKTILFGYSDGTCREYSIEDKKMLGQVHQLTSSGKPVTKLEVQYYNPQEDDFTATILISLVNGYVKWWNYDNLSLYYRFDTTNVIDYCFHITDKPQISLLTKNKYIHIFQLEGYWAFSKIAKVKLKKQPLDFMMYKDRGIISYPDNYEFIKLNFDENGKIQMESQKLLAKELVEKTAHIIYLNSVKAFLISKARNSYYVDWKSGSINKSSSMKIVWKSGTPKEVLIVRPYLVGVMEDGIELKCMYNPNRVVQSIKDNIFVNSKITVNIEIHQNGALTRLGSLLVYSTQKSDNSRKRHQIYEYSQIEGKSQVSMLIENQLYSTAMKICEFLMSENYERLRAAEFNDFQKGRAFYCFYVKKNYKLSLRLFRQVKVPTQEIILLFTELYHKPAIDQMIDKFGIEVNNIPYLKNKLAVYSPMIESLKISHKRKRTISHVGFQNKSKMIVKRNYNDKCLCASGTLIGEEKVKALQVFIIYFIECKEELSRKLKNIKKTASLIEIPALTLALKKSESQVNTKGRSFRKSVLYKRTESIGPEKTTSGFLSNMLENDSNNEEMNFSILNANRQSKCDISCIEPKTTLVDMEMDNDTNFSLLLFLSMMCEIYIFHALLILQKEDPDSTDHYRNELFMLIYNENYLPVDFCTELLIKHKMQADVCRFLFIKKEYNRLMYNIQEFYENTRDDKWLKEYCKYLKKIREEDFIEGTPSKRFIQSNLLFLLQENAEDLVIESLMGFKEIPPLYNKQLIEMIEKKGSINLKIKYLEYLTMVYKISESDYYTDLALSYVSMIDSIAKEKYEYLDLVDKNELENDKEICDLRKRLMKFLESNKKYNLSKVYVELPFEYMMQEVAFVLACDKRYSQAFEICIKDCDASLCKRIANKVYKLHKDPNVYFKLFEAYYDGNLHSHAISLLESKADLIPYRKLLKILKEDETLTSAHLNAFQAIFRKIEKQKVESEIHHKITSLARVRQEATNAELLQEGFRLSNDMQCSGCHNPFRTTSVSYKHDQKAIYHLYE
ncbi:unnamed protein product [Moneuplotes crassus]|uniref:CNH domain-containing protein n=1 Tax=Euplotes crassus TaxID=5936 RepID=A0AAD1XIQ8_EUPCR|nr:unnamed protein product [Moneuplotes crassus]